MIQPQSLYNGPLVNTLQQLIFESPAGKTTTIRFGYIVNTNALTATVNLYKKSGPSIVHLVTPDCPLDHNESLELDGVVQLEAGEQILGDASAAAGVTLILDGFDKDA